MAASSMEKIPQPLTIFLIGATGDLAKKKILKAVFRLYEQQLLAQPFTLVGNSRKEMTRQEFQAFVKEVVGPKDDTLWSSFVESLYYVSGDASSVETFRKIEELHTELAGIHHCGNHMWYLATLPQLYLSIIKNLKELKLQHTECGWTKILMEKPFGTDLATAQSLNQELKSVFTEEQIFRIDHYLGKETVQNMIAFRFANGLFENLWSKEFVDHIQVTSGETLGIDGREQFYDATGATRDVLQNHLLQMIAVSMMDEPKSLHSEDIRHSRSELIKHLHFETSDNTAAFGQFTSGTVEGQLVSGYLEDKSVPPDSQTETATAVRLHVDTERWQGVPIYVRTGKRFPNDVLELNVQFKDPANPMFKEVELGPDPNVLTFRFQPNEGIVLRLFVKKPGHGMELDTVPMQFCYRNQYQMGFIEAYERLIHDASMGDSTLFPRADSIESAWKIVDEILAQKSARPPETYPAGTWGPESFNQLIEQDGRKWIEPDMTVCNITW